jgi:hypothetical protein
MPRFLTVGELMQKDFGENTTGADELDLVMRFEQCNEKLDAVMTDYANLRSRMVAGLSQSARAAAEVMGQKLTKQRHDLENESIAIQRELIAKGKTRTHSLAKASFSEAQRDLAMLQQCVESVNSGQVKLSEGDRRRLRINYGIAQDLVRQSA